MPDVLSDLTPIPAVQVPGLKRVALRHLLQVGPWTWSSSRFDMTAGTNRMEFRSPQHLADELQGPCAEHGWHCDLSADQQSVLLSR